MLEKPRSFLSEHDDGSRPMAIRDVITWILLRVSIVIDQYYVDPTSRITYYGVLLFAVPICRNLPKRNVLAPPRPLFASFVRTHSLRPDWQPLSMLWTRDGHDSDRIERQTYSGRFSTIHTSSLHLSFTVYGLFRKL